MFLSTNPERCSAFSDRDFDGMRGKVDTLLVVYILQYLVHEPIRHLERKQTRYCHKTPQISRNLRSLHLMDITRR